MSEQDNAKIARQFTDNLNKHNNEANRSLLADNCQSEASGERQPMNREQTIQYTQRFLDAFPDLRFDVKDIIAQGDHVVTTWVATGTHNNPLVMTNGSSLPATHRKATTSGVTVAEIRNNKIVHQTITFDQVTLLMQLGVMTEQDMMAMARR